MSLSFHVDDLRVFCAAARKASFAAAAIELGASPAYVSKRIALLEKTLGVTLFHRSARRVTITDDGESVFASAQEILEGVARIGEAVAGARAEAKGTLRVTTSFRLGTRHVAPALSELARRHPELRVTLDVVDRRVDLIAEDVDLDVRVAEVDEPHLVAHRLVRSSRVLCAAPSYLARHGVPEGVAQLGRHECLVLRDRHQAFGVWRLAGPGGAVEKVKVTGRMSSNNAEIVRRWAVEGHGILLTARWDAADNLADGSLVRILPEREEPADVCAATTVRLSHSAKVRVCVAFLREQLNAGPFALQQ